MDTPLRHVTKYRVPVRARRTVLPHPPSAVVVCEKGGRRIQLLGVHLTSRRPTPFLIHQFSRYAPRRWGSAPR